MHRSSFMSLNTHTIFKNTSTNIVTQLLSFKYFLNVIIDMKLFPLQLEGGKVRAP